LALRGCRTAIWQETDEAKQMEVCSVEGERPVAEGSGSLAES
jgi:hypothetical protein